MIEHYIDPITIGGDAPLRLSADALRALKKATGRTMTDLVQDEDDIVRFQVMAFAELFRRYHRSGHMPPADELWEQAGAVELEFGLGEPLDPTSGGSSTDSPASAATGE